MTNKRFLEIRFRRLGGGAAGAEQVGLREGVIIKNGHDVVTGQEMALRFLLHGIFDAGILLIGLIGQRAEGGYSVASTDPLSLKKMYDHGGTSTWMSNLATVNCSPRPTETRTLSE